MQVFLLIINKLIYRTPPKRFPNEEACEQYLKEQREKAGVVCKKCGCHKQRWDSYSKSWLCKECGHRTRLTADTVMHSSNLPLMYWFTAIHLLTSTKKTFSAAEMQRQLGHKRYQPIWEMMHKLRSVMGLRDGKYKLSDTIELDEAFFTTESSKEEAKSETLKRGSGSQRKTKVLVMIESEAVPENEQKKGKKDRKSRHLKMKVIPNAESATVSDEAKNAIAKQSRIIADDSRSHVKLNGEFDEVHTIPTPPKDAVKMLPWVHTATSNAKSLILDMYHGIKDEFLQSYLDEFCWKFNRRTFGDRRVDRLVVAAVTYKPTFQHRLYNSKRSSNCG